MEEAGALLFTGMTSRSPAYTQLLTVIPFALAMACGVTPYARATL
jgi:hypothetical protein